MDKSARLCFSYTMLTCYTYGIYTIYVLLHTQMRIWSSGAIWSYLELSKAIWSYLELSEDIWSYLELPGAI